MRIKFPRKMKTFYIAIVIMFVYIFLFYLLIEIYFLKSPKREGDTKLVLPYVIVHLDLKGSPPKLSYLVSLLPKLKSFGANGLLMEYEDMFPYEGKLANLSASNCYGRNELKSFLSYAIGLGFDIIPLVQTFGHLEYALKLQEFQHLREDPLFPDSICPSKAESGAFVRHMLEQVISFHQEIKPLNYIHVGCDEVFHVKSCDRCRQRNESKMEILIQHIKKTTETVHNLAPNTTVMIWDDILQTRDTLLLNSIDLRVDPVSWCYRPKIDASIVNFYQYPPNFKNIWVASAFKGADGSTSILPNLFDRFSNNLNWLKLLLEYTFVRASLLSNRGFDFQGIILTGWSRYSHMDPLCDVLPASIPSLFINLMLIKKLKNGVDFNDLTKNEVDFFDKYLKSDVEEVFGCDVREPIDCKFDEFDLHKELNKFIEFKNGTKKLFYDTPEELSVFDYYFKLGMVNMNSIHSSYFKCNDFLNRIMKFEKDVTRYMLEFFDKATVEEYVNFLTYHQKKVLKGTMRNIENYAKIKFWTKRPSNQFYIDGV